MHLSIIKLTALFVVLSFSACSGIKLPEDKAHITIPENYRGFTADTSYQKPNWKQFYKDTSLVKLIDIALSNNFDLNIMVQRLEAAEQSYKQNRWLQLPSLNLFAGYGRRKYAEYTVDGIGNFDMNLSPNVPADKILPEVIPDYNVGLQSTWEIDVWGRLQNMKKAAKSRFLASYSGKNFYETVLVSQIAYSYYSLVVMDKELEIIRNNIELQSRVLELVKAQKESGAANELAIAQVNAQLLNTQAIEFEIRQNILEEETLLNNLLGRMPQNINRNFLEPKSIFSDSLKLGNPSNLVLNRQDVKQAEYELWASKADVRAARAEFLPQLNLGVAGGLNSFVSGQLFAFPSSMAFNAAMGLAAPIFNRREIATRFNIRKAQQVEAYIAYQKSIVNAYSEILIHVYGISNMQKVVEFKNQEVMILKNGISYASELYKSGNANYIEVITVQRNALQAEIELIHSQKRVIFENILLYQAMGGGW